MEFPPEVRLEVYDAIITYAASGTTVQMKPAAKAAFLFIKRQIDANNEKYDDVSAKRSSAAKKRKSDNRNLQTQANASKSEQNEQLQANADFAEKNGKNKAKRANADFAGFCSLDNDNENDISNTGVLDITRTRVKTQNIVTDIREHSDILLDKLQAAHGLTAEMAVALREEILAEWEFQGYENTLSDARKHFCNLFAIKARRPPTQQKVTAPSEDSWEEQLRRKAAYNLANSDQLDKQNEQWKQEIYK